MAWFGFSFFSVPVVIGTQSDIDVLSVRIVQLMSFTYPAQTTLALGLSTFLMVFVGAAWYIQGRVLKGGRHAVLGGRGSRTATVRLGVWRRPARALLVGYVALAVVFPLTAHIIVVLNGFWTPNIQWSSLSLEHLRGYLLEDPLTRDSLTTSLRLAAIGATVGIAIAAVFSHHLQSSRGLGSRVLDGVIKLPAIFSGIVVGTGCILAFAGEPWNLGGTALILLLATSSCSHLKPPWQLTQPPPRWAANCRKPPESPARRRKDLPEGQPTAHDPRTRGGMGTVVRVDGR